MECVVCFLYGDKQSWSNQLKTTELTKVSDCVVLLEVVTIVPEIQKIISYTIDNKDLLSMAIPWAFKIKF